MHTNVIRDGYKALVIGSGGAIGQAFVDYFNNDALCALVKTISRSESIGFDLTNAASIEQQAANLERSGPFHIIIDATGALHIDGHGPEKTLNALNDQILLRSLTINAVGPALVLRHFAPLLASGPAIYAKLSARVGSISDNRKGGWYSYRCAKAALNMILQTAALELQRRNSDLRVVALQPGTVRSKLSEAFLANAELVLEPAESVHDMMHVLSNLPVRRGAYFIDYKGIEIAW